MMEIYIIGMLFTMGALVRSLDEVKSWKIVLGSIFWPILIGHVVSGLIDDFEKRDKN